MKRVQHQRRRAAFSLLEILIVVGILALMAAFVVPSLMNRGQQAKVGMAQTAIGRSGPIASALKQYKFDIGSFPSSDEGVEALFRIPSSVDQESGQWKGPYLEGTPDELRDPWGSEYVYESPGKFNEDGYDLSSKGPDRKEDTEDDVKNWIEK